MPERARRAGLLCGLVLHLALAGAAVAGQEGDGRPLTLQEAVKMARQSNRDLKAAQVRIDMARVGIEQVRTALLPTATVQGRYARNSNEAKLELDGSTTVVFQPFNQLDFSAFVNVPLVVPWAYAAHAAAGQNVEREKASYETTEAGLLHSVAIAFYLAAGADELLRARENAIRVTRKTLDDGRIKVEAGTANRVDVTRAEIAVVQAQVALRDAEGLRADAYQALATLLQARQPFRVAPGAADLPGAASADDLAREAMNRRPEAAAYRRNIEVNGMQIRAQRLRLLPSLSGFGAFRAFNYAGFYSQENGQQRYVWALGLSLDWTLYDGGSRDAARHSAELQITESELRLAALQDTVSDEIARASRAVDTRRQALAAAEQVVRLATEALEIVRVQRSTGTVSQLELLAAQDALVKAEAGVASARFELALAGIGLGRAAGTFPGM